MPKIKYRFSLSYSRTVTIDSLKVDFVADKRPNTQKTTSSGGELA